MTLIALKDGVKSFGARRVLDQLDLEVADDARIGVVGANGSGKSTLLRILAGLEEPDSDLPVRRRDMTASYLPQLVGADARTPLQIVTAARPELAQIEADLDRAAAELADPEVFGDMSRMARVLRRQERLLGEFEEQGGHAFEGRVRAQLEALGIGEDESGRPTTELSGGKRKLTALAACLVADPDLLLLDEPETHLDAVRRSRLEHVIRSYQGAVVMVSHDRYMLDETVTSIAELDGGTIRMWPGNYSSYVTERELALIRQQEQWKAKQKEIDRLNDAIRRYKQWRVVSEDPRLTTRIKNAERRIEKLDSAVERPVLERRKIGLQLRSGERGGKRVVDLRDVTAAFGDDDPVLVDVDLTIFRGERLAVIGPNGAGKSVLLSLITGALEPVMGERWVGPSIRIGVLAQEHAPAARGDTPVDVIRRQRPCPEEQAVTALMRFLFTYEQVRQPISSLSGGERTRLELLLLMQSGANFLVLDEPTNHLDIDSVEMLEDAIERYDGTVVFSSHDRYFLDRIADRTLEIRHGTARAYEGGYSSWYARTGGISA